MLNPPRWLRLYITTVAVFLGVGVVASVVFALLWIAVAAVMYGIGLEGPRS